MQSRKSWDGSADNIEKLGRLRLQGRLCNLEMIESLRHKLYGMHLLLLVVHSDKKDNNMIGGNELYEQWSYYIYVHLACSILKTI